jgi:hypothetical protein
LDDRFGASVETPRLGIDHTGVVAGAGSWMCLAIAGRRARSPAREANARASAMDAISATVLCTCPRAMVVPVNLVAAVIVAGDATTRAATDASIRDLIEDAFYTRLWGRGGRKRDGLRSPGGPNTTLSWKFERSNGPNTALRSTRGGRARRGVAVELVALKDLSVQGDRITNKPVSNCLFA